MAAHVEQVADTGGAASLIIGSILWAFDKIKIQEINDYLVTITTLLGLVWMGYKIIGQIRDNRLKKKQLEKLDENNKLD